MGKVNKTAAKTVVVLVVLFLFFSSVARMVSQFYGIETFNMSGFLAVLVTSVYFTRAIKQPVHYMQAIKFSMALFVVRFIDFFTLAILSRMTPFASEVAVYLTLFLIMDVVLFTVVSYVYTNIRGGFAQINAGSRNVRG